MSLGFEWNNRKARTNLQKHGVDFVDVAANRLIKILREYVTLRVGTQPTTYTPRIISR